MKINDLYIPDELIVDVKSGDWTEGRFDRQIRSLLEGYDINLNLDIEYYNLELMFRETVSFSKNEFQDEEQFEMFIGEYSSESKDRTIDPNKIILIADFGFGSDQPIGLDFRKKIDEPEVWCLIWPSANEKNYWTKVSSNYNNFKRGKK